MNRVLTVVLQASAFLLFASSANAASWQILSVVEQVGATTTNFVGAKPFTDGAFLSSYLDPSLNAAINANGSLTIGFVQGPIYDGGSLVTSTVQPPSVNLSNMTINLSSIYMYGWSGNQTVIGSTIAPYYSPYSNNNPQYFGVNCVASRSNPVVDPSCVGIIPIVDNHNGTYTVSWYTNLDVLNPGGVDHFSMTFAQVVPLPASFWLLGSGLMGLVGMSRRKRATR